MGLSSTIIYNFPDIMSSFNQKKLTPKSLKTKGLAESSKKVHIYSGAMRT